MGFLRDGSFLLVWMAAYLVVTATAGTTPAGLTFLEENRNKDGVLETASGLQYKILREGKDVAYPTANSKCSVKYKGSLIDGTVFDEGSLSMAPNELIKGFGEALMMMVSGDKWEIYIPSEIGYGDSGSPPTIGPGAVLVFELELLAVFGKTNPKLFCDLSKETKTCNERESLYIAKIRLWETAGSSLQKASTELERLAKIMSQPMTDELRIWAARRKHILKQFLEEQKQTTAQAKDL